MGYKNKEDHAKAQARYRKKFLKIRDEALESGCMDCGNKDKRVLEFHHRNPEEKVFNVGRGGGRSGPQLFEEMEKCDIICANCHKIRHFEGLA